MKKGINIKKRIKVVLSIFLLTFSFLTIYYLTTVVFAWSGPSEGPPGGNIDLVGIVRNRFNMVEESVSGNVGIDLSEGSVFKHTLTGNVTYTGITGFSLGKLNSFKLVVEQDDENVYEITWPGNITWKNYEHPLALELSSRGIYDFVTLDDGTNWYGSLNYDSRKNLLVGGGIQLGTLDNTKPVCNQSTRGMMWLETEQGDSLSFCGKNLDDTFEWQEYASMWKSITATGGDSVTTFVADGSNGIAGVTYRVHVFTTVGSSSFVVIDPGTDGEVEYLVVAGGGGGGAGHWTSACGGGGGAGAVRLGSVSITLEQYSVFVGGGGVAGTGSGAAHGSNGGDSSFYNFISNGGGGGGSYPDKQGNANGNASGGGGGGAGGSTKLGGLGGAFGKDGGSHVGTAQSNGSTSSGGGGGAGAAGSSGVALGRGGAGGVGIESSIRGTSSYYGGGGGGGASSVGGGAGGIGGGGAGSRNANGNIGTVNTGGGGGGGGDVSSTTAGVNWPGGNGGSGIVVIRYPITKPNL